MECNIESKVMGDLGLAIQFHLEYEPAAIVLEGDQLDFDDRAVDLKKRTNKPGDGISPRRRDSGLWSRCTVVHLFQPDGCDCNFLLLSFSYRSHANAMRTNIDETTIMRVDRAPCQRLLCL
jgi:hypothetical protein